MNNADFEIDDGYSENESELTTDEDLKKLNDLEKQEFIYEKRKRKRDAEEKLELYRRKTSQSIVKENSVRNYANQTNNNYDGATKKQKIINLAYKGKVLVNLLLSKQLLSDFLESTFLRKLIKNLFFLVPNDSQEKCSIETNENSIEDKNNDKDNITEEYFLFRVLDLIIDPDSSKEYLFNKKMINFYIKGKLISSSSSSFYNNNSSKNNESENFLRINSSNISDKSDIVNCNKTHIFSFTTIKLVERNEIEKLSIFLTNFLEKYDNCNEIQEIFRDDILKKKTEKLNTFKKGTVKLDKENKIFNLEKLISVNLLRINNLIALDQYLKNLLVFRKELIVDNDKMYLGKVVEKIKDVKDRISLLKSNLIFKTKSNVNANVNTVDKQFSQYRYVEDVKSNPQDNDGEVKNCDLEDNVVNDNKNENGNSDRIIPISSSSLPEIKEVNKIESSDAKSFEKNVSGVMTIGEWMEENTVNVALAEKNLMKMMKEENLNDIFNLRSG